MYGLWTDSSTSMCAAKWITDFMLYFSRIRVTRGMSPQFPRISVTESGSAHLLPSKEVGEMRKKVQCTWIEIIENDYGFSGFYQLMDCMWADVARSTCNENRLFVVLWESLFPRESVGKREEEVGYTFLKNQKVLWKDQSRVLGWFRQLPLKVCEMTCLFFDGYPMGISLALYLGSKKNWRCACPRF